MSLRLFAMRRAASFESIVMAKMAVISGAAIEDSGRASPLGRRLVRDEASPHPGGRPPKVLSLSCLYPNPREPGAGLFVQRRLQHMAELTELQVVAPFAVLQYGNAGGNALRFGSVACPAARVDGKIQVFHPRWFYPPFGGATNAFWLFSQLLFPLTRLRNRFRFDVLDTHFGQPTGVAGALLAKGLGVPFTMTLRGNEPKHSRTALGRYSMRWALGRASRIFAVSERLRQFAVALGADPDRVKTIPNGIDPALFHPRERSEARIKHGLPLHDPVIVSAGALVERKGHHRILAHLQSLSARGIRVHLAIAGGPGPEGKYEQMIRRQVAELGLEGSVRFMGAVSPEEMAEIMSAADLLCLASTNEGWPNVVHEALACGTPVVATDVGAIPEMLHDDRYGIVVPANDRAALGRALGDALLKKWDREAISAWGRSRSWQQVASEVVREMQELVAENESRKASR